MRWVLPAVVTLGELEFVAPVVSVQRFLHMCARLKRMSHKQILVVERWAFLRLGYNGIPSWALSKGVPP
jgi:hypothetical protein